MRYVNSKDVLENFIRYLQGYSDLISKDEAIEELQDAIDSADYQEIDER